MSRNALQGQVLLYERCRKRQQGHIPCPLDSHCQLPLVLGAIARNPPRYDLATFRRKVPEGPGFFIIDRKTAVCTEPAHFSSVICPFPSAPVRAAWTTVIAVRHFHPLAFLRFLCPAPAPASPLPWALRSPWATLHRLWISGPQGPHCRSV